MTYLDYSATTKIDEVGLDIVEKDLFTKAYEEDLDLYKKELQDLLNTDMEVLFTSGSSESNNWAIKGICLNNDKKTIITTSLEHSSVHETLSFLEKQGFNIKYIPILDLLKNEYFGEILPIFPFL